MSDENTQDQRRLRRPLHPLVLLRTRSSFLRENMTRDNANHDAAPAATATKNDGPPRERTRPDGTGDTPTLTDAEREAVEWAVNTLCVGWHDLDAEGKQQSRNAAATLRGLLARLA